MEFHHVRTKSFFYVQRIQHSTYTSETGQVTDQSQAATPARLCGQVKKGWKAELWRCARPQVEYESIISTISCMDHKEKDLPCGEPKRDHGVECYKMSVQSSHATWTAILNNALG